MQLDDNTAEEYALPSWTLLVLMFITDTFRLQTGKFNRSI